MLKRGSTGQDVLRWQQFLNSKGYNAGTPDGIFGAKTETATKEFQKSKGLTVDGIVGPNTLKAAGVESDLLTKPVQPVSPSHEDLFHGSKVDQRNAAKLSKLAPEVQRRVRMFLEAAKKDGVTLQIVQGLRTFAEQDALYAQGRTKPGKRVTNAKGGQSLHNYGLAADLAPVVNGTISWDEKRYKPFGEWADAAGLEWGGRWTRFVDLPHVQYTAAQSLGAIQTLYRQGGLARVWGKVTGGNVS